MRCALSVSGQHLYSILSLSGGWQPAAYADVRKSLTSPFARQAEWDNVRWAAGNATAVGRDPDGKVVAVDTRFTSGAAAALVLSLDAPSALTGTGTALLADGQDTALVRATVVDSAGHAVHDASNVITFIVTSGEGRSK